MACGHATLAATGAWPVSRPCRGRPPWCSTPAREGSMNNSSAGHGPLARSRRTGLAGGQFTGPAALATGNQCRAGPIQHGPSSTSPPIRGLRFSDTRATLGWSRSPLSRARGIEPPTAAPGQHGIHSGRHASCWNRAARDCASGTCAASRRQLAIMGSTGKGGLPAGTVAPASSRAAAAHRSRRRPSNQPGPIAGLRTWLRSCALSVNPTGRHRAISIRPAG